LWSEDVAQSGESWHGSHCIWSQVLNLSACRKTTAEGFDWEPDAVLLGYRLDYVVVCSEGLHDVVVDINPERSVC